MRFNPRLPNDTATLLLFAVFIIVLVGISHEVDDPASSHPVAISSFGAVALLSVYAVWLWGYLRTGGSGEPALEQTPHGALPFRGRGGAAGGCRRRRRVRLGLVRRRARPGDRDARDLRERSRAS